MKLTDEIKEYIDRSVLCWLATCSKEHIPNVSPKEIFNFCDDKIIIANIASPQTVRNILENNHVCIAFIDIFVQKGFQIKGRAEIIDETDRKFPEYDHILKTMTEGKFPYKSITAISADTIKPIIAPKYILYPETTEEQQIQGAVELYNRKRNR